jgi:hypothetical protein
MCCLVVALIVASIEIIDGVVSTLKANHCKTYDTFTFMWWLFVLFIPVSSGGLNYLADDDIEFHFCGNHHHAE